MPDEDEYLESARDWVNDHVKRYIDSNGSDGHDFDGVLCCILTTRGRRSGKLRRTPLIYLRDGDRLLLVASKAGHDHHPHWYLNLQSDPLASVRVEADEWDVIARDAGAEERPALFSKMIEIYPDYANYQVKTEREIPVVILDRR
jgi:deazaflavin-dependent oxidoreductase (nitroreductase family)